MGSATLSLLDRKLTMTTDNDDDHPPPPVTRKNDPDAPPLYQPSNVDANANGQSSTLDQTTRIHAQDAYSQLSTLRPSASAAQTQPAPPLHLPPAANEVSIPFYSNPPPGPLHPALQPDRKQPILADVARPSRDTDRSPPFGCLTLHSNDKLGSANLSAEITNELDAVIRAKWSKGVQKWAYEYGGWCWQLNGKPWSHGDLATPARELLLALLSRLSQLGYSLHTSLLSSPGHDKDSLILRKTPRTLGQGRDHFAVCFYKSDRIKVIDCPDDTVREALTTAFKVWPEGVQSNKDKGKKSNNYSWKLKGTPWKTKSGDGECVTTSRALLCAILEEMEHVGWELVGSIKMTKPDDNRDRASPPLLARHDSEEVVKLIEQ